jgi:hypothetical protein
MSDIDDYAMQGLEPGSGMKRRTTFSQFTGISGFSSDMMDQMVLEIAKKAIEETVYRNWATMASDVVDYLIEHAEVELLAAVPYDPVLAMDAIVTIRVRGVDAVRFGEGRGRYVDRSASFTRKLSLGCFDCLKSSLEGYDAAFEGEDELTIHMVTYGPLTPLASEWKMQKRRPFTAAIDDERPFWLGCCELLPTRQANIHRNTLVFSKNDRKLLIFSVMGVRRPAFVELLDAPVDKFIFDKEEYLYVEVLGHFPSPPVQQTLSNIDGCTMGEIPRIDIRIHALDGSQSLITRSISAH